MNTFSKIILTLLKSSDTGIPPRILVSLAKERGIELPLKETRILIEEGYARLDPGHNGRPSRVKATNKAWELY